MPLTPEAWARVKAAVADALEQPATARPAILAQACGDDPELLREAESMLKHASDDTWIEGAVEELGWSRNEPAHGLTGQRVGDYRIVRDIGRGGMGAVYLGERADEQFQKEVAIKILKRGTDTEEVLRRFQMERQILAQLEHPNIAQLIDAGTTADGLPFFAMQYVRGRPITEYCEAHQLGVNQRVELFLKVCAAVEFAHRNLVVHRDLKPGNILVTDEGEPKLLDFGIAKLLAPDAGTIALTLPEQQRLTPGYAAPEQVRGEPVTTGSDVYALGALLFELLTGQTPHLFSSAAPSATELFRVVVEGTLPRASAVAKTAEKRGELRGDLDTILATALRKEPTRRYSGVPAFADDLHRYLDGRPVRAQPDTFAYRASKFIRRNKIGAAAALLLSLSLVGGIVTTAWQARRAKLGEARAEERFNQVRQLARSVLFDYHDAIAALPGSTGVRERLVKDALEYLDRLAREAGNEPELLRELASAYEKVAAVQGGAAISRRGAVISGSNLGDTKGAALNNGKALALRERLAELDPANEGDRQALASGYLAMASPYVASGPPEKAAEYLRKALPIVEPLLAANPANEDIRFLAATNYIALAKVLGSPGVPNLGDTKGALEYMRKAIAEYERLAAEHPGDLTFQQALANSHNALGLIFSATGDKAEVLNEYRKALAIDQGLVAAEPNNGFYRRELAVQLGNVGSAMVQVGDKAGALEYFRQALAIYDSLVAADPSDASTRRQWAVAHRNVGAAVGASSPEEARRSLEKANGILAELVSKDPKNGDFRRQRAFTFLTTSRFQVEIDDAPAAVANAAEGLKIAEALVADAPANASARNTLALLYAQLGAAHAKCTARPEPEQASQHWRSARESYGKSLAVYQSMKANGTLSGADANKPEEITREIETCDKALSKF